MLERGAQKSDRLGFEVGLDGPAAGSAAAVIGHFRPLSQMSLNWNTIGGPGTVLDHAFFLGSDAENLVAKKDVEGGTTSPLTAEFRFGRERRRVFRHGGDLCLYLVGCVRHTNRLPWPRGRCDAHTLHNERTP